MKKLTWISLLVFASCTNNKPKLNEPELMNYIELEGRFIKVVKDEYGNTFLKQAVSDNRFIYIPFDDQAEYEEPQDTILMYENKMKMYDDKMKQNDSLR
jgi:hypothetical protein